jgi:hypothetical protein
MKKLALTCAALLSLLALPHSARAESGFIAGASGGVAFGIGDLSGNGGMVGGEFGYQFQDEGGIATTLALALDYAQLDYNYSIGRTTYLGQEDALTLAPRIRLGFPIDDKIGFYLQGQVGVNFGDVLADFGWGAGAGFDLKFSELIQGRLGYQVIGDVDGSGYHGVLAAIHFKF